MLRYIIVGVCSGLLFGFMDGFINANPLARKLYRVFEPIARKSINIPAGFAIDLVYGFFMAGVFMLLYQSLPGESGLIKGLSYGLLLWFFRVAMHVATEWMMFRVPGATALYMLATGLIEMLVLGILYGLTLRVLA